MRIVSYNVRYFGHALKGLASTARNKNLIAQAVGQLAPLADIVCLQEVEEKSLRSEVAHRSPSPHGHENQLDAFLYHLANQFSSMGQTLPYQAIYFPAHVYRVGKLKIYTTGLAVLVNANTLRIVSHNAAKPHSVTHYVRKRFRGLKQTRICAHVEVEDIHEKRLHIFNTHLSLPSAATKRFWTQKKRMGFGHNQLHEAENLKKYIQQESHDQPLVLCGDFNAGMDSPVYRLLIDGLGLTGAQEELSHWTPGFASAGFMSLRMHLDHLFGRGVRWQEMDETVAFGEKRGAFYGLSDHIPLIATFQI